MPKAQRMTRLAGACVITAGTVVLLASGISTQAHEADGHPARIHRGSCDDLGAVAYQLTGVGAVATPDGTPVATSEIVGAASASPSQVSETTLKTSLSQLTKDPYAIAVYESDEAMDQMILCGNIGGVITAQMPSMIMPGDVLTIWLPGRENSGHDGVALLQANGLRAIVRLILPEELPSDVAPSATSEESIVSATPHGD